MNNDPISWNGTGAVYDEERIEYARKMFGLIPPPDRLVPINNDLIDSDDQADTAWRFGCLSAIRGRCGHLELMYDIEPRNRNCFCEGRGNTRRDLFPLLDHSRLWSHVEENTLIWTSEPFHFTPDLLTEFSRQLEGTGLRIWVTGLASYAKTAMTVMVYDEEIHDSSRNMPDPVLWSFMQYTDQA